MSTVGIVSIVLGALVVGGRGTMLLAPEAGLHWFKEVIATNGRLRLLGGFMIVLGVAMAWAGASEASVLASIMTVFGWASIGMSTLLLVLFPGVYRAIANPFLPSDTDNLFLWRFGGLVGVAIGGLLIYFGVLAL